jgi:hypothetical protein
VWIKNLSEVESSDSDNEIGDNQEYDHKSDTSNSKQGKQLQLSEGVALCEMTNEKSTCWVSPSGVISITNITIFHVCALVQRMHNNLYCMGIGDLNALTMSLQAGF